MDIQKRLKYAIILVASFLFIGCLFQLNQEFNKIEFQSKVVGKLDSLVKHSIDPEQMEAGLLAIRDDVERYLQESRSLSDSLPSSQQVDTVLAGLNQGDFQAAADSLERISFSAREHNSAHLWWLKALLALILGMVFLSLVFVFYRRPELELSKLTTKPVKITDSQESRITPLSLAVIDACKTESERFKYDYVLDLQGDEALCVTNPRYALVEAAVCQLVKNAIKHGGRSPAQRESFGKPSSLKVFVGIQTVGETLQITVADDGEGIDEERVVLQALEQELIAREQLEQFAKGDGVKLILLEGFSQASESKSARLSCVSLYQVQRQLRLVGGELSLRNRPGVFCEFNLVLPS